MFQEMGALEIILLSMIAGVGGMGSGGLLSVIIGKKSNTMMSYLLSFAGGVMVSVVCFGLVPEAMEIAEEAGAMGFAVAVAGLVGGIVVVMGLNRLIDKMTASGLSKEERKVHETLEDLHHASPLLQKKKSLLRSGILMLSVIALHNIPEGMAIGAGGTHDSDFGIALAIIIALHTIPEGMAVAAPLLAGGWKKGKIVFWTALAGATTLVGGVIGVLLGSISEVAIAASLAAAGGAMLYVVFGEIIPQSIMMTKNRKATIVTLFGILVGLGVTLVH